MVEDSGSQKASKVLLQTPSGNDRRSEVREYNNSSQLKIKKDDLGKYHKRRMKEGLPVNFWAVGNSPVWHFRALLEEGELLLGKFQPTPSLLPPPKFPRTTSYEVRATTILCHAKPTTDPFADIPDRWDIYLLLRHQFNRFGFVGANCRAMISKSEKTWATILELRNWELEHPYRRNRLLAKHPNAPEYEIEKRYAESALRAIKLEWPRKPYDRHRDWPKCLRDIGLDVTWYEADTIKYLATVFECEQSNLIEDSWRLVFEETIDGNRRAIEDVATEAWHLAMTGQGGDNTNSKLGNSIPLQVVQNSATDDVHSVSWSRENRRWLVFVKLTEFSRKAITSPSTGTRRIHHITMP